MEEGAESTSSTGSPNGTNPLSLWPNALSEDGAAEDAAGATRTTSGEVCLLRGCHLQKLRTGLSSTFAFAPWDFVAWRHRGLAARCGRRRRRKAGGLADAPGEYGGGTAGSASSPGAQQRWREDRPEHDQPGGHRLGHRPVRPAVAAAGSRLCSPSWCGRSGDGAAPHRSHPILAGRHGLCRRWRARKTGMAQAALRCPPQR